VTASAATDHRTHLCCSAAKEHAMSSLPDELILYAVAVALTVLMALSWVTI
jgi:hypothetical protein